jgi:hypothetical protein
MAGGLLNIIFSSPEDNLIYGNPDKTLFKSVYKRITKFGRQKFRIDHEGTRTLRYDTFTEMRFKIPRYAELLSDTYLMVDIPHIWSSFYKDASDNIIEYGFKWARNLGTALIEEVELTANGTLLAKYSGEYFMQRAYRDYEKGQLELWKKMTGDIHELNEPAMAFNRSGLYPNAYNKHGTQDTATIEPSIRGRQLCIPLMFWFGDKSTQAFPLVSLQRQELHITVRLRPIQELYLVKNVMDAENGYPYKAPNPNISTQQLFRFLEPPREEFPVDGTGQYLNTVNSWDADIHLLSNYIFLTNEEVNQFAKYEQRYLIREVHEKVIHNITNTKTVEFDTNGLICGYLMALRRSDVSKRNEWFNYTNLEFESDEGKLDYQDTPEPEEFATSGTIRPDKTILREIGFKLAGKYRENTLPASVYQYTELWSEKWKNQKDGLMSYAFELSAPGSSNGVQGGTSNSKVKEMEIELSTTTIQRDSSGGNIVDICDDQGNIIGTRKEISELYPYTFDLIIKEERYNEVIFTSGMVGLGIVRA